MLENLKAFGFSETFELCENKNGWSDQKDIKRISGNLKWLQGNRMQYLLRIEFFIFAPRPAPPCNISSSEKPSSPLRERGPCQDPPYMKSVKLKINFFQFYFGFIRL